MDPPPPYTATDNESPHRKDVPVEGMPHESYSYPQQQIPHQPLKQSNQNQSSYSAIVNQPVSEMETCARDWEVCDGEYPSNTSAIVTSCFVCCFCCLVFGCIGLVLAVQAPDSHTPAEARRKLKMANIFCVAGLVVGTMIYIISTALRITMQLSHDH